jgi:hypothetical protein
LASGISITKMPLAYLIYIISISFFHFYFIWLHDLTKFISHSFCIQILWNFLHCSHDDVKNLIMIFVKFLHVWKFNWPKVWLYVSHLHMFCQILHEIVMLANKWMKMFVLILDMLMVIFM